jgi:hypothetical protein
MKPVIIIVIAVVCSVVVVLGVLMGLQQIATMQAQQAYDEYQQDLNLSYSYNEEYYKITYDRCVGPVPTSYGEAVKQLEIEKQKLKNLNYYHTQLSNLEGKMDLLQKKYPNSEYFTFDPVTCPYDKEWGEANKRLEEYRESQQ